MNSAWLLSECVFKLLDDIKDQKVMEILENVISNLQLFIQGFAEPIFIAMTNDIESTFVKIHAEFGLRKKNTAVVNSDTGTSQFVQEFSVKIRWIQKELLCRIQCGDDLREWYQSL